MTTEGGTTGNRSMLGWLPVAWLCLVMALSARGIDGSLAVVLSYDFPGPVLYFIWFTMLFGAVTILWGLYLLFLAYDRSQRFAVQFMRWQSVVILVLVARELYVLAAPDFAFSLASFAWTAGEVVVGAAMIVLVRRERQAGPVVVAAAGALRAPVSVPAAIALTLLGIVLGGALGLALGLGGGQLYAEATDMSCFEGGCGYFVIFMGLGGTVAGAISGGVFALWRVLSRGASRPV